MFVFFCLFGFFHPFLFVCLFVLGCFFFAILNVFDVFHALIFLSADCQVGVVMFFLLYTMYLLTLEFVKCTVF